MMFVVCSPIQADISYYVQNEFNQRAGQRDIALHLDFGSKKLGEFKFLGREGLEEIVKKRDQLHTTESLLLDGNRINASDCIYFLNQIAPLMTRLRKIDLSCNPIAEEGAQALAANLHHWQLLEVLLINNSTLHTKGLESIFEAASNLPNLRILDVSSNAKIDGITARNLGVSCAQFRSLEQLNMAHLGMDDAELTCFASGMKHALAEDNKKECVFPLKIVNFGDRYGSVGALKAFIKLFPNTSEIDFHYRSNLYKALKIDGDVGIEKYTEKDQLNCLESCLSKILISRL
jgi:hypothetical protein